jgi:hypothetical protein
MDPRTLNVVAIFAEKKQNLECFDKRIQNFVVKMIVFLVAMTVNLG